MQFFFRDLISEIQRRWPDFDVKEYKNQDDTSEEIRLVINSQPAKALQLCYWNSKFVQVDILPEYFPEENEDYHLYIQFKNKGHFFTNHGGNCFIFQLTDQDTLEGEDAYDKHPDPVKIYSKQQFTDMILQAIARNPN
ncbi:MAG TPA: hypothetical protein VGN64_14295 [Dyadobacter sp.]|jgi:hypothetical protein|nr:hypothetical protein [Dyadobacter sp.]